MSSRAKTKKPNRAQKKKTPQFESDGTQVAQDDIGFWCYCQPKGLRIDFPGTEGAKPFGELAVVCPVCSGVFFIRDGVVHKAK